MPVDSRVYQPMGILHGGATVALAESVGSGPLKCSLTLQKKWRKCRNFRQSRCVRAQATHSNR